jgi:hypothetical protein
VGFCRHAVLAVVLSAALAAELHAATLTFDFTGMALPDATLKLTLQPKVQGSGPDSRTLTAWGYSDDVPGVASGRVQHFLPAWLTRNRGGMGVCNGTEQTACIANPPAYAIDNSGTEDWLLLTFDHPVQFKQITLSHFEDRDYDISYWYGTDDALLAGLDGKSFEHDILSHSAGSVDVTDTAAGQRIIYLKDVVGNFLLIGGSQYHDLPDSLPDYFLINALDVQPVPAPTSIILLASGLALIGGLRLRRMH